MVDNLNNDVWGSEYGIVMKRVYNRLPYDIPNQRKKEIVNTLFAKGRERTRGNIERQQGVEPFTKEELQTATETIKGGKAAAQDGIPPEAIKEAAKTQLKWLLGVLNKLLRE
ncbi:hypothetical protein ILUMI_10283 [Ignelater luminosus]|uniref:Uncharacterized protein n=1 Tax=Ignelater luminosus TaxID=2038154 RepID=A0A8K0GBL6_IGNLU|nr:hypothetical protein ILUMI_10283 [Ignelater luminosus]